MKRIGFIICLLLFSIAAFAQLQIASWNIQNLGETKNSQELQIMAECLKGSDIIAIQEVVTNPAGEEKLAELTKLLGGNYKYLLSVATISTNTYECERYAYLYNTTNIKVNGKPGLFAMLKDSVAREPFMVSFTYKGKSFTMANFHAIPKKKQPQQELKYLKFFAEWLNLDNIIFVGDFNCSGEDNVFNPIKKQGYKATFVNQKTTLRQKCIKGDCLASAYDNLFYHSRYWRVMSSGIVPFYEIFGEDMKAARKISDHVPIIIKLQQL